MSESEYELIVNVLNEHDIQAQFSDGAEASGEVNRDPLRRDTIRIFAEWLNESRVKKRKELQLLGTLLYDMIFNEEIGIGTFFEKCLGKAKQAQQSLILRLSFREIAGDLADLPWEYLFYDGQFLSTCRYVELVLSRFVPLGIGRPSIPQANSPLKVLIVDSNPKGPDDQGTYLPPVGADQVIQEIQKLAQDVVESPSIKIEILDKPTVNRLEEQLNKFKPHVLHFIGHCQFNKEKKAEIALLDEDEESVRWVEEEFIQMFRHIDSIPSLVLLHLCESAETMTNHANFTYLAPRMLNVEVPAVVAMQHPITNQAAIAFCTTFYSVLARGESIDAAVQEGRWRIATKISHSYDNRVFGTPVLYMRSHGGIIRPVEQTSSTQPQSKEPSSKPPSKVETMTSDNREKTRTSLIEGTPSTQPEEPSSKSPRVKSMTSDKRTETSSSLTLPESTGNLSAKQGKIFGEPGKAESASIEPRKTDSNLRYYLVTTIISAGKNKMAEMTYLTAERQAEITQMLSIIRNQLYRKANAAEMKGILLDYLESDDSDFLDILWSMIEALEKKEL